MSFSFTWQILLAVTQFCPWSDSVTQPLRSTYFRTALWIDMFTSVSSIHKEISRQQPGHRSDSIKGRNCNYLLCVNVGRMLQRNMAGRGRDVRGMDKGAVKKSISPWWMYLYYHFWFSFKAVWNMITLLLCLSGTNLKLLENISKLFQASVY